MLLNNSARAFACLLSVGILLLLTDGLLSNGSGRSAHAMAAYAIHSRQPKLQDSSLCPLRCCDYSTRYPLGSAEYIPSLPCILGHRGNPLAEPASERDAAAGLLRWLLATPHPTGTRARCDHPLQVLASLAAPR